MGKKILGFILYMTAVTGGILWFAEQEGTTEAGALALLFIGVAVYGMGMAGNHIRKRKKKRNTKKKKTEKAKRTEKDRKKEATARTWQQEYETTYRQDRREERREERTAGKSLSAKEIQGRKNQKKKQKRKWSWKQKGILGSLVAVCLLCTAASYWVHQSQEIPESLLTMEEKYPEAADFVKNYPRRKHYRKIDISSEVQSARANDEIPFFLQWDERWGYETYGSDFLAVTGCGPTCISMVVCGLTGDDSWNPLKVAEYSQEQGYYIPGEGTSWSLMTEGAQSLGLTAENIQVSAETIYATLQSGQPMICSMYPGDFTYTGHFIVLTGIDENGDITVHDPNSRVNTEKHWSMEEILPQIRQSWSYHV